MQYQHFRTAALGLIVLLPIVVVVALYGGSTTPPPSPSSTSSLAVVAPPFHPVDGLTNVSSSSIPGEERTFDVTFRSSAVDDAATALGHNGMRVLLPADYLTSGKRYPVIYLLHGMHLNYTMWDKVARATMLRATAGKDVIIVMPDGGPQGFYTNWVGAGSVKQNWEDFHINQLIPFVDANLRTIATAQGRAIAGMSMGGFGAMRYAADHPELFSSVASISGAVDIQTPSFTAMIPLNAQLDGFPAFGAFGSPRPGSNGAWTKANPTRRAVAYKQLNTYAFVGSGATTPDAVGEAIVREGFYNLRSAFRSAGLPEGLSGPGGVDHYFLDYGASRTFPEGTCPGDHGAVCNAYALGLALPMLIARLSGQQAVDPVPPVPAQSTSKAPSKSNAAGSSARK